MKNWIIGVLIVVLFCFVWGTWNLYSGNRNVQVQAADRAISKAKSHYQISKIDTVTYYHGTNAYQVVEGERNGVKMYLWIPDQKKKAPYIARAAKRGISKTQAMQIFNRLHLDVKQVVSIRLGAINKQPTWQITFLSPNHTYNYISLSFDTGKEVQRILNI